MLKIKITKISFSLGKVGARADPDRFKEDQAKALERGRGEVSPQLVVVSRSERGKRKGTSGKKGRWERGKRKGTTGKRKVG